MNASRITSPEDAALDQLCEALAAKANSLEQADAWPEKQLRMCGEYGVFEWFLPVEQGGQGWSEADIVRGYLKLSAACLTTTFVITQRTGACRRIAISENQTARETLLPGLLEGRQFATVGISHLTTSRRHLTKPVLRAEEKEGRFLLDGFVPWVTGAPAAEHVVTGATLDDGRQILIALPMNLPGVEVAPVEQLVGLTASQTGAVTLDQVEVDQSWLLAGPVEHVMQTGAGAKTGGLQTSTLALGLAKACIAFVKQEGVNRTDLLPAARALSEELESTITQLLEAANGEPLCSPEELRARANSLVLRSSQAAMTAAKGAGYVVGHPAGRWCREALFFLVWSCPQPVLMANLCELAGVAE